MLSGIVIALVAGAVGFYLGTYAQSNALAVSDWYISLRQGALVDFERTRGSDSDYETALRRYIALLDELEGRKSPELSGSTYLVDKSFALIRLSRLLERRGDQVEAAQTATMASEVCAKANRRDCSVATLVEITTKLDERSF